MIPDSIQRLDQARQALQAVADELRKGFLRDSQPILSQLTAATDQLEILENSPLTGQRDELLAQARELRREAARLTEELDRRSRVLGDWREAMGGRFTGYLPQTRGGSPEEAGEPARWEA